MEYMPEFNSEKEFNQYFQKQTEYCSKHRDNTGTLSFKSENEFKDFLNGLFGLEGINVNLHIKRH